MPSGVETSASYGWHAEHCGVSSKPTLNQTGELNDAQLVDEDRLQLGVERVGVLLGREVAALPGPSR